jgi:Fe2+ or Zn2+ uptake regulation protein
VSRRQLDELAQARGLRMTPQRNAIVEHLEKVQYHPTAEEVFTEVNRRFPMTSRATVYNTLKLLSEAGLLREIRRDHQVRYDPNLSPHHHFICRRCGRIEDLPWESIPPLTLEELIRFRAVDSYEITLFGHCRECQPGQT